MNKDDTRMKDRDQAYTAFFKDIPAAKKLLSDCTADDFLNRVSKKYHFSEDRAERKALFEVAHTMQEPMRKEAAFSFRKCFDEAQPPQAAVVITLGDGIDFAQEEYTKSGCLTESYMLEAIAGEILLDSYRIGNEYLRTLTGMQVARYDFPGSFGAEEKKDSLRKIPWILAESGLQVKCNEAFYLMPSKSVVFYAVLSSNPETVCPGVCVGCGNPECPNRMEESQSHGLLREADLVLATFNYGYARIFGKKYGTTSEGKQVIL